MGELRVYVNVCLNNPDAEIGSTLVFDTLRTGFPNAKIHVVDNSSIPSFKPKLKELAKRVDAHKFFEINRTTHGRFITEVLNQVAEPTVFVDPDVVFWDNMEYTVETDKLFAGRYIPNILDCGGVYFEERIHPSLFVVPNPRRLLEEYWKVAGKEYVGKPFEAFSFMDGRNDYPRKQFWRCFDVCAGIYAAIPNEAQNFEADDLDRYDHLFCGSLLNVLDQMEMSQESKDLIRFAEKLAKECPEKLRGLWKTQEKVLGQLNEKSFDFR